MTIDAMPIIAGMKYIHHGADINASLPPGYALVSAGNEELAELTISLIAGIAAVRMI